jgi:hypothetical protein
MYYKSKGNNNCGGYVAAGGPNSSTNSRVINMKLEPVEVGICVKNHKRPGLFGHRHV